MSRSASQAPKARGSFATAAAFLFGMPAGLGLLYFLHHGPYQNPDVLQYIEHPVEMTEVVMFCGAVGALLAKIVSSFRERSAQNSELLPRWPGQPVPVTEAAALREHLDQQSSRALNTFLGRRVANVLEFVDS